jgi:hypothetical protein
MIIHWFANIFVNYGVWYCDQHIKKVTCSSHDMAEKLINETIISYSIVW